MIYTISNQEMIRLNILEYLKEKSEEKLDISFK